MGELTADARKKIAEISRVADLLPCIVIIHNFQNDFCIEYMSQNGLKKLGVTMDELKKMGSEYHTRYFNSKDMEDYRPKVENIILNNDLDQVVTHFQQVRSSPNHEWEWYLSAMRILLQDESGQPYLTITHATPISPEFNVTRRVSAVLEAHNFYSANIDTYNTLSKREKEVLSLVAQAKSNKEISADLFISINTVETHKKKLREKLNINSSAELVRFARAYEL